MSPRKKPKPNPKAPIAGTIHTREGSIDASSDNSVPSTLGGNEEPPSAPRTDSTTTASSNETKTTVAASTTIKSLNTKPSRKWLGGSGSWRSKAPAVAQLAKESIGVSGGATSELSIEDGKKEKAPSPRKLLSKRRSSKGDTIPAAMTKLNVSSDGSINDLEVSDTKTPTEVAEGSSVVPVTEEPPLPPEPPKEEPQQSTSTFGWRSWWSRPDGYMDSAKKNAAASEDASTTPLPGVTPSEDVDSKSKELAPDDLAAIGSRELGSDMKNATSGASEDTEMKDTPPLITTTNAAPATSWFWLWSSAQNAKTNASQSQLTPGTDTESDAQPDAQPETRSVNETPVEPAKLPDVPTTPKGTMKPSGWAFWSKEKPKEKNEPEGGQQKQVGEVAVFNTPSQSHPEAAQFNEQQQAEEENSETPVEEKSTRRSFLSLRGRPKSKAAPPNTPQATPSSSKGPTPSKTSPTQSPTRVDVVPVAQPASKESFKPTLTQKPNLVLPEFKSTYRMVQQPSFWQQIRQYFLGGENAMPHLHINPAPPRIKKAIAIGVHGYFPAAVFQKILGQPTGTSVRFSNAASAAIKNWTEAHGYSTEIEQIALEGEGFIADRINTLWKLLLNWIEHIKQADLILVACHSQGVPVAIMLVAKLIQFGCVNAARIGVCAMAGVNLGPFIEYKTKYFGPTAAELFEFSNPKSLVSQMYLAALDEVLRYGVRITYIGSIDDQLVSLESSTFSNLSHPYIYRAVFVDGRIHAPDFLSYLVGFVLKLRNLGLPDHGLIRELSPALAGSLVGGQGHSTIYEEPHVYWLAVQHTMETTSLPVQLQQRPSTSASFKGINIPIPGAEADKSDPYALKVKEYEAVGTGSQNPFFLPWAMRGLLEEDLVKKELGKEVEELLSMFEHWQPNTKMLKDVKFRLEAVRSRL